MEKNCVQIQNVEELYWSLNEVSRMDFERQSLERDD